MDRIANNFLNREAVLVLKGKQRIRRWVAAVQADRVITYPVGSPHSVADSNDPEGREIFRYSQLLDIVEVVPMVGPMVGPGNGLLLGGPS
jgi:hypothetical protein